jgi:hypothetical protein
MPRLDKLPDELLVQIASHLRPDDEHTNWGGNPEAKALFKKVQASKVNYLSLALTNKALCPSTQESLLKSVVLGFKVYIKPEHDRTLLEATEQLMMTYSQGYGMSRQLASPLSLPEKYQPIQVDNVPLPPMVLLLRTLLENKEYGKKIQDLTLMLPRKDTGAEEIRRLFQEVPESPKTQALSAILDQATQYITTLGLTPAHENAWISALRTDYPFSLVGLILTLAPNLQHLTILILPSQVLRAPGYPFVLDI